MKILLLVMPFGALDRQALGVSILKARLVERGFSCDIRYLNFSFSELIGYEEYVWMNYQAPYTAFAGDWSFTEALYGPRPDVDQQYIDDVLLGTWRFSSTDLERLRRIRSLVPHFINYCRAVVPWSEYAMVGFTSTFEQNLASLALARVIKQAHPGIRTIFGGANWEGEMGQELHRQFPFVDYVCSGEAEMSLVALAEHEMRRTSPSSVPGIVYRDGTTSISTGPAQLIPKMDDLPVPDYSDYFHDLSQSTIGSMVVPTLLFESSRGCWWGAKSHCTFCGLNGGTMAFRAKSPRRALEELTGLVREWRLELVEAVDNILDMTYFREFLPALSGARLGLQMFYEVKANLSRRHLRLLRDAGVTRIQPGIESMSDHVLALMRKGTTALRNIQVLKWCRDYGISSDWNLLYGFPGETREDYRQTLELLPSIRFLPAPTACGPLRLDRFSPYHKAPADYGIVNIRPMGAYRYLYPFDEESLTRIAYYFDYGYETGVDPTGYAAEVIAYANEWKENPEHGALTGVLRPDGTLALVDTRADASWPALVLSGLDQAAYEYCDEVATVGGVVRELRTLFPDAPIEEERVQGFLDSAVENRLMVRDGKHYLSLAVATQAWRERLERAHDSRISPLALRAPSGSLPLVELTANTA
jgi:ribosomal peptide maturation radical SAM protein 1